MPSETRVERTDDFHPTGAGDHPAWGRAAWLPLTCLQGAAQAARAKLLWSANGLYGLFDCEDRRLTCTHQADGADLYDEDVVEIFLQPDESQRTYFEYEVSPLGFELPIMIANDGEGAFFGWLPWKFRGQRRTLVATDVRGGEKKPGASVTGWSAEFFLPFALLRGLANVPPTAGTRWRANLFRIDYDDPSGPRHSAWSPPPRPNFHDMQAFGTLVFA